MATVKGMIGGTALLLAGIGGHMGYEAIQASKMVEPRITAVASKINGLTLKTIQERAPKFNSLEEIAFWEQQNCAFNGTRAAIGGSVINGAGPAGAVVPAKKFNAPAGDHSGIRPRAAVQRHGKTYGADDRNAFDRLMSKTFGGD